MQYLCSLFLALGICLSAGCADQHCPSGVSVDGVCADGNAGRVVDLSVTQPWQLEGMVGWPEDGIYQDTDAVLLLGVYRTPTGELRIYGGPGTNVEGPTNVLRGIHAFDVPAVESELGIYTEPFSMKLPMADDGVLTVEETVLHAMVVDDLDGVEIPTSGRLLGIVTTEIVGAAPDFDLDEDGVEDSWVVGASFTTELAWML